MKYRIETQQVFGMAGQGVPYDTNADWCEHIAKPRGKVAAIELMKAKFASSGFKPPIRVVAVDALGDRVEVARIESPHKPAPKYAVEVATVGGTDRKEFDSLLAARTFYLACSDGVENDPRKGYTLSLSLIGLASGDTYYKYTYVPAKKLQTMSKRFPITNSGLAAFTFAGFQWPRYVAALPKGSKAKRLERYKAPVCGPYYHAPKPVKGSNHGTIFYLNSDGMPGMRWAWCDEVEGVGRSINHTGWYTDEHGDGDKIRGVVFTLPKGRGFLAGWSMGESMASGVEYEVYTGELDAAQAADDIAKLIAEVERESQNDNTVEEGV
jgi:hypothetical protein